MRTKGKLKQLGAIGMAEHARGSVLTCLVGTTERAQVLANTRHAIACWNAVEAVGGQPETVAELVGACRHALGFGDVLVGTSDEPGRQQCLRVLRAVLAKAAPAADAPRCDVCDAPWVGGICDHREACLHYLPRSDKGVPFSPAD